MSSIDDNIAIGHELPDVPLCVAFSPDGQFMAGGTRDGDVQLWQVVIKGMEWSGEEVWRMPNPTVKVSSVAFGPDGTTLAIGKGHTIELWQLNGFSLLGILDWPLGDVTDIQITPDGRYIISGGEDGRIRFWSAATLSEERQIDVSLVRDLAWQVEERAALPLGFNRGAINALALTQRGDLLASAARGFQIWNAHLLYKKWPESDQEALVRWNQMPTKNVNSLAFSDDGLLLATGEFDGSIRLWDITTGSEIQYLGRHEGCVSSIAFSPDRRILVSGCLSDQEAVRIWDVARGEQVSELIFHGVTSIRFNPEGTFFAVAHSRGFTMCPIQDFIERASTTRAIMTYLPLDGFVKQVAIDQYDSDQLSADGKHEIVRTVWGASWELFGIKLEDYKETPSDFIKKLGEDDRLVAIRRIVDAEMRIDYLLGDQPTVRTPELAFSWYKEIIKANLEISRNIDWNTAIREIFGEDEVGATEDNQKAAEQPLLSWELQVTPESVSVGEQVTIKIVLLSGNISDIIGKLYCDILFFENNSYQMESSANVAPDQALTFECRWRSQRAGSYQAQLTIISDDKETVLKEVNWSAI